MSSWVRLHCLPISQDFYFAKPNLIMILNKRNYLLKSVGLFNRTVIRRLNALDISLTGNSNESDFRNKFIAPKTVNEFNLHLLSYFKALSTFYVLTNRSKIKAVISITIRCSLLSGCLVTSDFYTYIRSNSKFISVPVGIAKLIDYIAVPSARYLSDGTASTGKVSSLYDFRSLVAFISDNYLFNCEKELDDQGNIINLDDFNKCK
jgi:hypothetical protein